ncbi:ribose 5-phosphate isomerase B [Terracoccus luteus]|jgi:ribose 5-phosphate isomerase B|uniref:Ribose-5-phosphate isomerase B n=1 Tax=Terracoccus luteus TaxID=53356 RepID=A0A495XSC9_9MICO|nr:ribose-5-phosphate isomerase [Terracoccus luteus]RKT77047.1 ribose 5-phosphate isomerase B [Terracoccus luteus]
MRIHIGGDHAAYELQRALVAHLAEAGHDVVDHGPLELDPEDDYPVFVLRAAESVANEEGSLGVVLGGSGNGEQIAANKVAGIRAALAYEPELARLARQHNDAHIVSIGARFTAVEVAKEIVDAFVSTEFSDEPRHARRLGMVTAYETSRELPAATQGAEGSAS